MIRIVARRPRLAKSCIWMRGVAPLGRPPEEMPRNGNYILQKPFKAAELLAAVDEVLGSIQPALRPAMRRASPPAQRAPQDLSW